MGEHDVPAETVHPGPVPDAADRPASPAEERPGQAPPVAVARARVSVAGATAPPPDGERPSTPATGNTYRAGGSPTEPAPALDRRQPGASVPPPSTWSAFAAAERSPADGATSTGDEPAPGADSPAGTAPVAPAPRAAGSAAVPAPRTVEAEA
ncbi:hypothetical protein ACWEH1_21210, partial [Micromonospora chersina]